MSDQQSYKNYVQWKKWDEQQDNTRLLDRLHESFGTLLNIAQVTSGSSLLEIGFGNCYFMDWAREQGYSVEGVEILSYLVEAAQSKGHQAWEGRVEECEEKLKGEYDAIIALDVFEHLSLESIHSTLEVCGRLLRPGGVMILRVPNGGSPFGLMYQNGDYTHITAFTLSKMQQVCIESPFQVVLESNPPRALAGAKVKFLLLMAFAFRNLVEWVIGKVYFGRRKPMDPSIVFLLKHKISE